MSESLRRSGHREISAGFSCLGVKPPGLWATTNFAVGSMLIPLHCYRMFRFSFSAVFLFAGLSSSCAWQYFRLPWTRPDEISPNRLDRAYFQLMALMALFVLFGWVTLQAGAQSVDSAHVTHETVGDEIESKEPRPMKATVKALAETYGWIVDYEDPIHLKDSPDVFDMTDPTWRSTHPNDRFLGLRGDTFTIHLAHSETATSETPLLTVKRIVGEYNRSSLPSRFAVRTGEGGRVAVVGVATRNSAGAYKQQPVLLDTPLELLPSSTLELSDALPMLTAALSKASGHQVVLGTSPINLFNQVRYVIPTEKLSARTIVGRMLDRAPVKLTYTFLYDLNDDVYVLNVSVATRVITNSRGVEQRLPLPSPQ
jgi:hypothetical protein